MKHYKNIALNIPEILFESIILTFYFYIIFTACKSSALKIVNGSIKLLL